MRVVLTGATGFVGRYVVAALARKHEVVSLVRDPALAAPVSGVSVVEWDLRRPIPRRRLPTRADAIVHLAQAYLAFPKDATRLFVVNAASTQWLAEYARSAQVSRFVYASSGSVYQPRARPLTEDAPVVPPTYHPATKRMSELMLSYYEPYFSLAILRLFAPYGPGQVDRLIPRMIESVRQETPVSLSRGGEPRINPIFVDDLVAILAQALGGDRTYTVNLAGPRVVSMRSLARLIGDAVGKKPTFVEADNTTGGNLVADTRRMHELFDVATMVEPGDGIARVVAADLADRA